MGGVPEAPDFVENPLPTEDALASLRMRGSVIHRELLRVKMSELNKSMADTACHASDAAAMEQLSVPWYLPPSDSSQAAFLPPPAVAMAPVVAPVLRLAEAVAPPQLGTPALPSIDPFYTTRGNTNHVPSSIPVAVRTRKIVSSATCVVQAKRRSDCANNVLRSETLKRQPWKMQWRYWLPTQQQKKLLSLT